MLQPQNVGKQVLLSKKEPLHEAQNVEKRLTHQSHIHLSIFSFIQPNKFIDTQRDMHTDKRRYRLNEKPQLFQNDL